jgi:hypothetical protein
VTRLVVVSHNPALPFALNSAGHEVVVVDDEADVRWAEYIAFAEIVVLDLGDPAACQLLMDGVARAAVNPVRVLLLASAEPAWQALLAGPAVAGTAILPLPLTMPRLSATLDMLLNGPPLGAAHELPGVAIATSESSTEGFDTPSQMAPPVPPPADPYIDAPPMPREDPEAADNRLTPTSEEVRSTQSPGQGSQWRVQQTAAVAAPSSWQGQVTAAGKAAAEPLASAADSLLHKQPEPSVSLASTSIVDRPAPAGSPSDSGPASREDTNAEVGWS